jgi:hypothetical protein
MNRFRRAVESRETPLPVRAPAHSKVTRPTTVGQHVAAMDSHFSRASVIVEGSVARVKRRFCGGNGLLRTLVALQDRAGARTTLSTEQPVAGKMLFNLLRLAPGRTR